MDTKTCTTCKIGKQINNFHKRYTECKDCNRTRGLKRNFENKDKLSNNKKIIMKRIEKKYYYRKKQQMYTL